MSRVVAVLKPFNLILLFKWINEIFSTFFQEPNALNFITELNFSSKFWSKLMFYNVKIKTVKFQDIHFYVKLLQLWLFFRTSSSLHFHWKAVIIPCFTCDTFNFLMCEKFWKENRILCSTTNLQNCVALFKLKYCLHFR